MDDAVQRAQDFIWTNARLLERQLFAHYFSGSETEPVLVALRGYQNADGGFGNALEPDKRDPHSQPVDVQFALETLDEIDRFSETIVTRVCDFLQTITTAEGGVPFALPSVNAYPHAPWWQAVDNPPAALNPTAAIAGLMLKHGVQHPWVERATAYCRKAIAALDTNEFHTLMPVITFLEHVPERAWAEQELQRVAASLSQPGVVAHDPNAEGYVQKPLDWAPLPQSFCRRVFADDLIATHLAALAARQQPDGGWPISWEPISQAVGCEWRGIVTIKTLRSLQAYGVSAE